MYETRTHKNAIAYKAYTAKYKWDDRLRDGNS
jgi:hypothetical protein